MSLIGTRWRSINPKQVYGMDRRSVVAEAVVTSEKDEMVYLKVTKGNGSRKGRIYGVFDYELADQWERIHDA
jgi:hypothetical protein